MTRTPLHRMVFAVCFAAWALRAVYLSVPEPLSFDELAALTASDYATASRFVADSDWAQRWITVETASSGGRVLWSFWHLIWGYLFPSAGQMAFLFNLSSALIAMLALAGAARHLYGERGFLLTLLITSVSPLFLNYTVRVLATMPAVMWICLALFAFSSPRSTLVSWLAGGLCLGLAFGTHYGAGTTVAAIICGLAVSVVGRLIDKDVPKSQKIWECAIAPLVGAAAAVAPLVTLHLWAAHAGRSYTARLFLQANLRWPELGPYGLWLRELLELDPLLQVILFVAALATFRSTSLKRPEKTALGVAYFLMLALLITSTDGATPRAFVSLGLFGLVSLAVYLFRVLDCHFLSGNSATDQIQDAPAVRGPFEFRSLITGILVLGIIFTFWRLVSGMPRGVFPGWPLCILGLAGLTLRLLPDSYDAVVRGTALLGSLLFVLGAGATYHAKSAHSRARAYALEHPHLTQLVYEDFWAPTRAMARLSRRSQYEVVVIGPPARLYPASTYEEEPYKTRLYRQMLRDFSLEGVLAAEEIAYSYVFFGETRPEAKLPSPSGAS